MESGIERPSGWITKEQLFACLAATGAGGVTEHQLERWRTEGLLPRVDQEPLKGHGSAVRYPPGSCEQIRAIQSLRKKFKKLERIGWELWWQGFDVDERHWRPQVEATARLLNSGLKFLRRSARADERAASGPTLSERVAEMPLTNILLSRVQRRLKNENRTAFLGTLIDVTTGRFVQFPSGETQDENFKTIDDEAEAVKAFDLGQSEKDRILAKKLNLVRTLPSTLREIGASLKNVDFMEFMQNKVEIENARNDWRNANRFIFAEYNAVKWIYGERAFGLRFASWVARKTSPARAYFILFWIPLRRVSRMLLPSSEFARLAAKAETDLQLAVELQKLRKTDHRFQNVLDPKRLRRGLKSRDSFLDLQKEIRAARMRKQK